VDEERLTLPRHEMGEEKGGLGGSAGDKIARVHEAGEGAHPKRTALYASRLFAAGFDRQDLATEREPGILKGAWLKPSHRLYYILHCISERAENGIQSAL